jgi:3-(3-hydroxy-phenyl)propionate hydroxylase
VLIQQGRITPTWQIRVHESGDRAEFDLGVLANETRHPYRLQCHQRVLSETLLDRVRAGGGTVRFGETVHSVGQDERCAFAELEDGSRLEGRFLVGCDGARSVTRDAVGAAFEGDAYPEITVLATTQFAFEDVMPGLSGVNYIWKEGGTFSLLRLPDVWRCSFQARLGEDLHEASEDAALSSHLREIVPDKAREIRIDQRRPYRVHRRLASRWRNGRLFIAGDAAHLNSPKGGMGLNGGIHDAFELANAIAAAFAGSADHALDLYERRRKPVVAEDIIGQADANRARMAETGKEARLAELGRLQAMAADPTRCRVFLLKSSMIEGLRKGAAIQ